MLAACTSSGSPNAASGPVQPGKPVSGGTVTVKRGDKVICIMTVVNGKGTCKVPARNFGIGTSLIYGTYSGGGRSRPVSVTVQAASTTTALTITPARVTYGQEQAGHLSVKVTAAYGGTPTGTVTVTSSGVTACLIKLSAAPGGGAQGSCALAATKLALGSQPLTAFYPGDHWYVGSTSAAKTLTVVK
jgi:hypothetical protein